MAELDVTIKSVGVYYFSGFGEYTLDEGDRLQVIDGCLYINGKKQSGNHSKDIQSITLIDS